MRMLMLMLFRLGVGVAPARALRLLRRVIFSQRWNVGEGAVTLCEDQILGDCPECPYSVCRHTGGE
jgi:hypothetical protein